MDNAHTCTPFACSIAGSDSGGGAGIQADLKTFSSLGIWGCTVVTAVTAQNPKKVAGVWPLPEDAVKQQIKAVLDEYPVRFFKTGMLANSEIIKIVSESLPPGTGLVLDPVMVSTSGTPLLEKDAVNSLMDLLIPKAALVTPNLLEAASLSDMKSVETDDDIEKAGRFILDLGAEAVLIKGGHGEGESVVDTLIGPSGITKFSSPRFPCDIHGTGCCLSAAITSYLARGFETEESCAKSKKFIEKSISAGVSGKSGIMSVNPSYGA